MFSLRLIALDEAKTMILALWGEHACDERPTKSRPLLVHSWKRRRPCFVPNLRNWSAADCREHRQVAGAVGQGL